MVSANVRFDEHVFPHRPAATPVPTQPVASSSKLPPPSLQDYVTVIWFDDEPTYPPPPIRTLLPPQQQLPTPGPSAVLPTPGPSTGPPYPDSDVTQQFEDVTSSPPSISPDPEPQEVTPVRKSTRKKKVVKKFKSDMASITEDTNPEGDTLAKQDKAYLALVELFVQSNTAGEPTTYEKAIEGADSTEWIKAMNEEFDSLEKMGTWEEARLPAGRKAISCKWVYRIKRDADGNPTRYKARLVA